MQGQALHLARASAAQRKYALWALPATADQAVLAALFDRLSSEFGVPAAVPHVTLAKGRTEDLPGLSDFLRRISTSTGSLHLDVNGFEHVVTENYRTIALALRGADSYATLCDALRSSLDGAKIDEQPRMTLLYARLSFERRKRLLEALSLPLSAIRFDRVCLVSPREDRWEDITGWRMESVLPLASVR